MTSNTNALDHTFSAFLEKFRYELIASFALLALLGGIVLAVLWNKSQPAPIEVSTQQQSTESQPIEEPAAVLIDIAGAVQNPGVYELPVGSRVKDVLDKAGGLSSEVNSSWVSESLNQADLVQDGQKIYIPFKQDENMVLAAESGVAENSVPTKSPAPMTKGKVNLNQASLEELMTLPGIGESYGRNIINARPFKKVEELLEVDGIGPKRFEKIRDLVRVN
jgi:competence protein ComEA